MVGDNKRWSMQFNGLRLLMTQWWEEDVGDILQLTISARFLSYTHANLLPGCLTAAALATGTLCLTCQKSVTTPCLLFMSGWFISLLMLYAKAMACLIYLPICRNVFSFTVNTILRTILAAGLCRLTLWNLAHLADLQQTAFSNNLTLFGFHNQSACL